MVFRLLDFPFLTQKFIEAYQLNIKTKNKREFSKDNRAMER